MVFFVTFRPKNSQKIKCFQCNWPTQKFVLLYVNIVKPVAQCIIVMEWNLNKMTKNEKKAAILNLHSQHCTFDSERRCRIAPGCQSTLWPNSGAVHLHRQWSHPAHIWSGDEFLWMDGKGIIQKVKTLNKKVLSLHGIRTWDPSRYL